MGARPNLISAVEDEPRAGGGAAAMSTDPTKEVAAEYLVRDGR
jgi:hypothetical protein